MYLIKEKYELKHLTHLMENLVQENLISNHAG